MLISYCVIIFIKFFSANKKNILILRRANNELCMKNTIVLVVLCLK